VVGIADTAFKYFVPELGAFFIYALTMAILLRYPNGIFGRT
jgi:branched-chain amino acid transport system permease protein